MITSMTAYAREEQKLKQMTLVWELRSINHRFLDASINLPEGFQNLEQKLKESMRKHLARGKVDCYLRLSFEERSDYTLNMHAAKDLIAQLVKVSKQLDHPGPINPMDVLKSPGVQQKRMLDLTKFEKNVQTLFEKALKQLVETRQREGHAIQKTIDVRLKKIDAQVTKVKKCLPAVLKVQREKLLGRLRSVAEQIDQGRLEQELVFFANKADVAEEIDRLTLHLKEVKMALEQKGAVGRRLDFLMQELNREVNTLGAKANDAAITKSVVELKVLIEQIREQVQNIE